MTELHELLDEAGGPLQLDATGDITGDLARGRRALRRRRTRWAAGVATGGLVAAAAVTYAALPEHSALVVRPATDPSTAPTATPTPTPAPTRAFYDVPTPPDGWHVVGQRAQYVMLTRDGSGVTSIDSGFIGQIVIGLTDGKEHFESQPSVQHGGRTFFVNAGQHDTGPVDTATISVRNSDGNWLQAEFPLDRLSVDQMIAYLDGVVVGPGARAALG
jgi:hypothetical protein